MLLRYADPAWLVRLVLGLGGGARVLEPPELAAEVARRARAALAGPTAGTAGARSGRGGRVVIGVVGAAVTFAVVLAIVLVLAVRPPARRFARAARRCAATSTSGSAGCARPAPRAAAAHHPLRRGGSALLHWGSRTAPATGPCAVSSTLSISSVTTAGRPVRRANLRRAEAMPGGWEWLIIIGVLVLLFGAKRLPEMARSVGQSARVFKGEMKGLQDDEGRNTPQRRAAAPRRPAAPAEPAALPPGRGTGTAGRTARPHGTAQAAASPSGATRTRDGRAAPRA